MFSQVALMGLKTCIVRFIILSSPSRTLKSVVATGQCCGYIGTAYERKILYELWVRHNVREDGGKEENEDIVRRQQVGMSAPQALDSGVL